LPRCIGLPASDPDSLRYLAGGMLAGIFLLLLIFVARTF
jgi:hypothetical protein